MRYQLQMCQWQFIRLLLQASELDDLCFWASSDTPLHPQITTCRLHPYNTLVLPIFLYGSENWTPTASQRRKIEAAEMKLLRPQNKRLHTPWITDYMDTRQDRWIRAELASSIAKNATKPNPFEIIPLQATRKENIWKTEETLARFTVVTLETERIKESNPCCL